VAIALTFLVGIFLGGLTMLVIILIIAKKDLLPDRDYNKLKSKELDTNYTVVLDKNENVKLHSQEEVVFAAGYLESWMVWIDKELYSEAETWNNLYRVYLQSDEDTHDT
jgi:hypothetical protein